MVRLQVVMLGALTSLASIMAIGHLEIRTGFRHRLIIALLDGSVLILHMAGCCSTACCLYGARLKCEETRYVVGILGSVQSQQHQPQSLHRAALCALATREW